MTAYATICLYKHLEGTPMKLLIASDIHGAAEWCEKLIRAIEAERPDRVVLLGDLLYHGPRNDLPADYNPRRVIELLSSIDPAPLAVRGNCDAEVDQMVLPFPIMDTSAVIHDDDTGHDLFFTHGHVFGPGLHNSIDNLPPLKDGDSLIYGHTHIKVLTKLPIAKNGVITVFNPGSVGIPKDKTNSYGIYVSNCFVHQLLNK